MCGEAAAGFTINDEKALGYRGESRVIADIPARFRFLVTGEQESEVKGM